MRRCLLPGLILLLLLKGFTSLAQLSVPGMPLSSVYNMNFSGRQVFEVTPPVMDSVRMEDANSSAPFRYAVNLKLDLDLIKDGEYETCPGGEIICRSMIHASGAQAVTVYFDRFYLPEGARLFLYDPEKNLVIGAFTRINNNEKGLFATQLIPGDRVILEYQQPATSSGRPVIHINEIAYAYRGVSGFLNRGFGDSGTCEVNINCPEGTAWHDQARGVARISTKIGGASYWCTGTLINNVRNDFTPYFLTADHCGHGATPENFMQWVFYFHYESPYCENPPNQPNAKTLTGAFLKSEGKAADQNGSDFLLVRLVDQVPQDYDIYFNGWSRQLQPPAPGVTIHHPEGDIKKISTYTSSLISTIYGSATEACYWTVYWVPTASGYGVTEPGSSGSPLFDNNHRIVGTLTGGNSMCDSAHHKEPDYYGKFSWSWESNGTDSTSRLRDWLDPDNAGAITLNGITYGETPVSDVVDFKIHPNPVIDQLTIEIANSGIKEGSIKIFNIIGEIFYNRYLKSVGNELVYVNTTKFPSGVYFMRINLADKTTIFKVVRL